MNNSNLAAARNLIQVVTGEWKSRCVYVATRLGLADLIESGIDLLGDVEGSFRDMVLFYGEEFHAAWTPACEALLSGTPGFELAFGEDFYS